LKKGFDVIMFEDLTLISASYGNPDLIINMLKSFVHIHGDGPFKCIISENSIDDAARNLLLKYKVAFLTCPGNGHSQSIDTLIKTCNTKHALLLDTDILFNHNIEPLFNKIKKHNAVLAGIYQGSRGGYRLYPRLSPHFLFIDTETIKKNNILFHDNIRINKTNSQRFYSNPPINPNIDNTEAMFDVGSTFYDDVNKAGLIIVHLGRQPASVVEHYEGMSWHVGCGNNHLHTHGLEVAKKYTEDTEYLKNIDITGKFIYA